MQASHPWKSTGSKRTISWNYEPSELVMKYLFDMRDAVRNGVLMTEEMRRRNGKIPTPINLRRELKPWFDTQFDYARHHINPVCQAAVGALKSHRKKKIKKPTPEINKLSMRLDAMLVRVFPDSLRITIKPGVYEWIPLIKQNKRWGEYANLKLSEVLITGRIVVLSFSDKSIKKIASKKVGLDINFQNVTGTAISASNPCEREYRIRVFEFRTSNFARIQNDYSRNRKKIQKRVGNQNKKKRKLLRLNRRRQHRLKDSMHKLSSKLVKEYPHSSFVLEDLTGIKKRGDRKNKKFRSYLNSWPYYAFQKMIEYKSSNETIYVDPRGTSSVCPFCGEMLKHPSWKVSSCKNCDRDYDRDRLASLAIAHRGLDLCGDPFPVSALASLQSLKNEYL